MSIDAGTAGKSSASVEIADNASEIRSSDQDTHALLCAVIKELKKLNLQAAIITDCMLENTEVE